MSLDVLEKLDVWALGCAREVLSGSGVIYDVKGWNRCQDHECTMNVTVCSAEGFKTVSQDIGLLGCLMFSSGHSLRGCEACSLPYMH